MFVALLGSVDMPEYPIMVSDDRARLVEFSKQVLTDQLATAELPEDEYKVVVEFDTIGVRAIGETVLIDWIDIVNVDSLTPSR